MKKNIRKQIHFTAPIQQVWAAITQPAALSKWFMEADFEPTVGYNFTFKDKPQGKWDGILVGEVLTVEEPYVLEYSWKGDQMKHVTQVRWQLETQGSGTVVTLHHTGFMGLADTVIGIFHQFGWNRYFKQLLAYLAETQ